MSVRRRPPLLSSLPFRLSVAISGVVVLCVAACVLAAVIFLRQALSERARLDLQRTLDGVSNYMQNQRNDLLGAAELVAADPVVGSAVKAGDLPTLTTRLSLFYTDLNANVLDVIDTHGHVIAHMEDLPDPQAYGGVGRTLPSVRAALGGQEVTAFDTSMPQRTAAFGYALRATVPLYSGSRISGAIVLGRQLDSLYAGRIGNALNATVNLIVGTQRTMSNGSLATAPAATEVRIARGRPSIADGKEDGHDVLSGLVPLPASQGPPVAAVEVVSRLDPFFTVVTQLSYLMLILGITIAAVGTVLTLSISRRITARLLELESAAAHVAALAAPGATPAGKEARLGDLHAVIAVRGSDEVASLARSFRAMMAALDERMEANERLYEAAQARVRELTGLAEIARLLTATSSLQETLEELSAHVCRLVGGKAVAIVLHGEGVAPNVSGGWGLPDNYATVVNTSLSAGGDGFQTAPEMALRSGKVAWRPVAAIPDTSKPMRDFALSAGWGGTLGVPLRLQERAIGALAVYTASAAAPSEAEVGLLTTIADQVAVVVENARLQEQARHLAAVQERQRLARELHDSVSQALYGIALGTRTARTLLDRDPSRVSEPLDYVLTLADAGLTEMRALIFELRPEALETEGLVAALEKQVAFVQARHGIAVVATMSDEPAVPYSVKEALYRIGQEALHNIVKHARAQHVVLHLDGSGPRVVLEVCDDGAGFHPQDDFPGHLGLHTMRERAVGLGGTLQVESAPGRGTRVRAEVPRQ